MRRVIISLILVILASSAMAQSTLKDGIRVLSERYGVNFVYDSSLPVDTAIKDIALTGKSLRANLNILFADSGISWRTKGKYVLLSKETAEPQTVNIPSTELSFTNDTLAAASITGFIDRSIDVASTGLVRMNADVFKEAFATLSTPDVIKTMQALPGVSAGTEFLSGLYVHGGDGNDNLYLLDGVPVYQVCHLGGILSAFNIDAIENMDFYKSGFPARFGGRSSSVLDISTREGSLDEYHGQMSLGLLEARAYIDGPIVKGKTSFSLALRRSWSDAITSPICWWANAKGGANARRMFFRYSLSDLNAKVSHRFDDGSHLTASTFIGQDLIKYNAKTHSEYASQTLTDRMRWGNTIFSVNWNKQVHDDISLKVCSYYTGSHSVLSEDSTSENEASHYLTYMAYKSMIDDIAVTGELSWKPEGHSSLNAGGGYIMHRYHPSHSYLETGQSSFTGQKENSESDIFTSNSHELYLYGEEEYRRGIFTANIGLRGTAYISRNSSWVFLEPRINMRLALSPNIDIKASYTHMSQFSHLISTTYLDLPTNAWMPSSTLVPPATSHQAAAGIYGKWENGWKMNVEGWYKTMENLIEYSDKNSLFPSLENWENKFILGKGRSYGVEVDMGYRNEHFMLNAYYTLSWNQRKYDFIWTDWYPDKYDNRHKVTLQTNWKPSKKWEFYAAWNFHSGNRINLESHRSEQIWSDGSVLSSTQRIYVKPNNIQLPAYHRLDLGINIHTITRKGRTATWNISIYNVYSRMNPIFAYLKKAPGMYTLYYEGIGVGIFPIIPSFSYTLYF